VRVDRKLAAAAAAAWLTLPLVLSVQEYVLSRYAGHPISISRALVGVFPHYAWWAGMSIPILWLAARFPIERGAVAGRVILHVALSFFFYAADGVVSWFLIPLILDEPQLTPFVMGVVVIRGFYDDFLLYWAIVGAAHLLRQQRVRAELERAFAESRMQSLQAQLQPHFLFNTLNSIAELMHVDPAAADRMLTALSDLLRVSLDSSAEAEIPLRDELEILDLYLRIQQVRFSDSITIVCDVDPAALDVLVPTLLLQPLVENAFRHGLARRKRGTLTLRIRREGHLRIELTDDGVGLPPRIDEGIGLANTRARLAALHGEEATLSITEAGGGGTVVIVNIPEEH
jgi:two-component system LytT family sensor kinase